MGKYIRKAKTAMEVAVMDVSHSPLGARTRARTLALQRLQKSSTTLATAATSPTPDFGDGSYLQLRSRRLEKPPVVLRHHESKRMKQRGIKEEGCGENPNPNSNFRTRLGKDDDVGREEVVQEANGNDNIIIIINNDESKDFGGIEASFGENVLDSEARERGTRESNPCNLLRDPESIRTPGPTTRPSSSTETNRRLHNSMHGPLPTAHEMDEFFFVAEEELQRQFIEKYNCDPVNDKPLPGRYEWEKLNP